MTHGEILATCFDAKSAVQCAGYPLDKCVWEFTQEVVNVLTEHARHAGEVRADLAAMWGKPAGQALAGIPFRVVDPDSPPITLKMVHLQPFQ